MAWEVEGTNEFAGWFGDLNDDEHVSVGRVVELLVEHGPSLPFPCSSGIAASRHRHMRDLRVRRFFCWADKTANDRWYDEHVPLADTRYDEYLRELKREGLI